LKGSSTTSEEATNPRPVPARTLINLRLACYIVATFASLSKLLFLEPFGSVIDEFDLIQFLDKDNTTSPWRFGHASRLLAPSAARTRVRGCSPYRMVASEIPCSYRLVPRKLQAPLNQIWKATALG
jgi:hypothetical protein